MRDIVKTNDRILMAISNFSWIIPGKLAGSGIPGCGSFNYDMIHEDIKSLSSYGIKLLVSLHLPPIPIDEICKKFQIEWKYFPIPDFSVPGNVFEFSILVDEIINRMKNENSVCIHCQAGIGRTGMVLSCVLGKWFALDGKKAIESVKNNRHAIETDEQMRFVISFLGEYEHRI